MINESDIISRIRRFDDTKCFRILYEYYISDLYYFVLGYVKSEEAAKDISQETFATVWKQRKLLDENKSIRGYLFTITYHNIIKELRRISRHPALQEYLKIDNEPSESPERKLDFIEFERHYSDAKSSLTDRQKEIFELYREQDTPVNKIAEELGIKEQVVRNQLSTASKKIRSFFMEIFK